MYCCGTHSGVSCKMSISRFGLCDISAYIRCVRVVKIIQERATGVGRKVKLITVASLCVGV